MIHSILVNRNIALSVPCVSELMADLIFVLEQNPAVNKAVYDSSDNRVLIEYNQCRINYTGLLSILSQQGVTYKKGFGFNLQSSWYDYLDTTARENAAAPPPACCNKPPKR